MKPRRWDSGPLTYPNGQPVGHHDRMSATTSMTLPQLGSGLFLTDGGIETSLIFRPHPQVGETCGPAGGAATRSVPVVFALVPDPVGAGYVESLARPGGNATGYHCQPQDRKGARHRCPADTARPRRRGDRMMRRREFWTFKGAPWPASRVKRPQIEGLE